MRLTCLSLIPALVAGFSFVAHADLQPATDPQISIDADNQSVPITLGSTCAIGPQGGGICDFVNETGSTINLLEFEDSVCVGAASGTCLPGLPAGSGIGQYPPSPAPNPTFTCDPTSVFAECVIVYQTPPVTTTDEVTILFENGPGIANGEHFAVNLNNDNNSSGVGGWAAIDAGTFRTVEINTSNGLYTGVPEPSMMWILAGGCGLIFALRRVRSLNLQR